MGGAVGGGAMDGFLRCGRGAVPIPSLPPGCTVRRLARDDVPAVDDVAGSARRLLCHPTSGPPLRDIVRAGETVAVAVSDATRLWFPTREFLPTIIAELRECGVRDEDIRILVAVGTHRRATEQDMVAIVGEEVAAAFSVTNHDCDDQAGLVHLGATSRGTPVWVNRTAMEADRLILTGAVTFHNLAGFSGGPKSILPGLSSRETVQTNHLQFLLPERGAGFDPAVCSANLTGNPIHEDMLEAARLAAPDFVFNVTVNSQGRIAAMFAGELAETHRAASRWQLETFAVPFAEPADLVLASCGGVPRDMNLYQAYKGMRSAMRVVRPGGLVVLYAECPEGTGNAEMEELLLWDVDLVSKEDSVRSRYTNARAIAFVMAVWLKQARVALLSGLDPDLVKRMGFIPSRDAGEVSALLAQSGQGIDSCFVIPTGAAILPVPGTGSAA